VYSIHLTFSVSQHRLQHGSSIFSTGLRIRVVILQSPYFGFLLSYSLLSFVEFVFLGLTLL
jgi:hypothetical protein